MVVPVPPMVVPSTTRGGLTCLCAPATHSDGYWSLLWKVTGLEGDRSEPYPNPNVVIE